MSWLDIVIVTVAVLAVVYGVRKGFIVQIGALGGVIAGIVLCRLFARGLADFLTPAKAVTDSRYAYDVCAYVVLFLAGYFGVRLIAHGLKQISSALCLSLVDRLLGAIFSLFEWLLILSVLMNVWQAFSPNRSVATYGKLMNEQPAEFVLKLAPTTLGAAKEIDKDNE